MIKTLLQLLSRGIATQQECFPALPKYSRGLPGLTSAPCAGCDACAEICPTRAITVTNSPDGAEIALDRGLCITCGLCVDACPTGTITSDRETRVAAVRREDLILTTTGLNSQGAPHGSRSSAVQSDDAPFRRSIHLRVVSTGDSASDLEVAAANNAIFDASRFGIHFVASPRFADGLIVTGPVPRAMQEPLRRCYEAMARPRLVIAVGASAITGGIHRGGYAAANGVDSILPVAVYIPGSPPHPWNILHGILLAMQSPLAKSTLHSSG